MRSSFISRETTLLWFTSFPNTPLSLFSVVPGRSPGSQICKTSASLLRRPTAYVHRVNISAREAQPWEGSIGRAPHWGQGANFTLQEHSELPCQLLASFSKRFHFPHSVKVVITMKQEVKTGKFPCPTFCVIFTLIGGGIWVPVSGVCVRSWSTFILKFCKFSSTFIWMAFFLQE